MVNKRYEVSTDSGFFLGADDEVWAFVIKKLIADNVVFTYVAGTQKALDQLESEDILVKQEIVDLYRGRTLENDSLSNFRVDSEILSTYLEAEQVCMEICDRMDQSYSFSRHERERLYINALEYWLLLIEEHAPKFIIMTQTPHSVYDYVLYAIAKAQGIPLQMYLPITILKRILPYTDYKNIGAKVLDTYQESIEISDMPDKLPEDLQAYLDSHSKSYSDVIPQYLTERLRGNRTLPLKEYCYNSLVKLAKVRKYPDYIRTLGYRTYYGFRQIWDKYFTNRPAPRNYLKLPNEPIEATSGLNRQQWRKYKKYAHSYKIFLKNNYVGHCKTLDISKQFVYVPLPFQPEKTSTPEGGRYSNQIMMIRLLSSCLPSGWEIVVKENPSQLLPELLHGERGRYAYYYDDLARIPHVRIVPVATDQFTLIDNSVAVATITGTTGWEAVVRFKPVLCFGYAWYQGCEGVFSIANKTDCRDTIDQLEQGVQVDKNNVHRFLSAIDRHSFPGFSNIRRYPDRTIGADNNIANFTPIIKQFLAESVGVKDAE